MVPRLPEEPPLNSHSIDGLNPADERKQETHALAAKFSCLLLSLSKINRYVLVFGLCSVSVSVRVLSGCVLAYIPARALNMLRAGHVTSTGARLAD